MYETMESRKFYRLMNALAENIGYLSGDSCKVLLALALRPDSRGSLAALRQVTCIEEESDLIQAIDGLEDLGLARYDGKGGIAIQEVRPMAVQSL